MAENFVAEFAGVAGAGDDDGDAVVAADAADGESEDAEFIECWTAARGPEKRAQGIARLWALDRNVVNVVGG